MPDKNLPFKIGLLSAASAYFLFTLHALLTLEWIGEWSRGQTFRLTILIEDISATAGTIFRFVAAIIAIASIIYYFTRELQKSNQLLKILRTVVVLEGIYWLGLSTSAIVDSSRLIGYIGNSRFSLSFVGTFSVYVIAEVVESIILPIALFIFAYKLNARNSLKSIVKWALIVGTVYVLTFWLLNSSIWLQTIRPPSVGFAYLTTYPQNLVSFLVTLFGMLALTIYAAYTTKKTVVSKVVSLRAIGVIVLGLGMFFLWNYLSWVFFDFGKYSEWYAWFLGHNVDLWMLALPLVGLPMLFMDKFKLE